jgi:hypothetical protein
MMIPDEMGTIFPWLLESFTTTMVCGYVGAGIKGHGIVGDAGKAVSVGLVAGFLQWLGVFPPLGKVVSTPPLRHGSG